MSTNSNTPALPGILDGQSLSPSALAKAHEDLSRRSTVGTVQGRQIFDNEPALPVLTSADLERPALAGVVGIHGAEVTRTFETVDDAGNPTVASVRVRTR